MESLNKCFSYAVESDADVGGMQFRHQGFRTDWCFIELTNAGRFRWLDDARRSFHCGSCCWYFQLTPCFSESSLSSLLRFYVEIFGGIGMAVMKPWRSGRLIVGLILACLCSGCVALAVGAAGGVAGAVYVMGKLQEEVNHPIAAVHEATLQGLRDLDLPIDEDKVDKLAAHVESKLADGTHVWVDLDSIADSRTKLTIRVGVVGDEARSRKVLAAIKTHLS
jgi:hypothetical protein